MDTQIANLIVALNRNPDSSAIDSRLRELEAERKLQFPERGIRLFCEPRNVLVFLSPSPSTGCAEHRLYGVDG